MHELSIAQNIIEIINQNVQYENLTSVKNVKVKIGKLSNILPDSLLFCFDSIKVDSPLVNCELIINQSPVLIECGDCKKQSEIESPIFSCPNCKSNKIKIIGGSELIVEQIELNDNLMEQK